MLTYDNYNELLTEGFTIKNNVIYFNPNNSDVIKTSFGKNKKYEPYKVKLKNGYIYSVYIKNTDDKKLYTEVLKTLKNQSSKFTIDFNSYLKFINRTAIYLSKIILDENIDTILLMDSSSNFVTDLSLSINKHLPKYYDIFTYKKEIFKNSNLSEIYIDTKDIVISDELRHDLEKSIERMKGSNYFSIKKIPPQYRKFITNWLLIKIQNSIN